jgi:DNA-binding MarR family transcriptional regulator
MSDQFDTDAFESAKRNSFLQVLFKAARLVNERSLAQFREQSGRDGIRPAHSAVFPHIPFDGIRLTDLADTLGVTKQATQQLVDDLEAMELIERTPDPSDGRAKLIQWSKAGREGMSFGVALLKSLESEYAEAVGEERLQAAHEVLLEMIDLIETS